MEKKIEDYLHLYMGCACEIRDGIAFIVDIITPSTIIGVNERKWKVKPVLRPLSDMTNEELEHMTDATRRNKSMIYQHAERTAYLLSQGFDLFGLIESRLAIDKKTIK